jgi:hypothetical protein
MLAAILLTVAAAAGAPCEEPVTVEELRHSLDLAATAWVVMDRGSFEASTAERRAALPCLSGPVDPELAIQLHLHEALAWSLERRSDLSQAAFRSILALQPSWELPGTMAPGRHRLRIDFELVRGRPVPDDSRPLAPPGDGSLLVDGLPAEEVPRARPFVVQMLDREDRVQRTHYFTPGSELPDPASDEGWWDYQGGSQPLAGGGGLEPNRAPYLLGGAVGVALLAGGLYTLASVRAAELERGGTDCGDLESGRQRVNQLVGASAGLGVVGVGLGISGLVVAF